MVGGWIWPDLGPDRLSRLEGAWRSSVAATMVDKRMLMALLYGTF